MLVATTQAACFSSPLPPLGPSRRPPLTAHEVLWFPCVRFRRVAALARCACDGLRHQQNDGFAVYVNRRARDSALALVCPRTRCLKEEPWSGMLNVLLGVWFVCTLSFRLAGGPVGDDDHHHYSRSDRDDPAALQAAAGHRRSGRRRGHRYVHHPGAACDSAVFSY